MQLVDDRDVLANPSDSRMNRCSRVRSIPIAVYIRAVKALFFDPNSVVRSEMIGTVVELTEICRFLRMNGKSKLYRSERLFLRTNGTSND